MRRYFHLLLAPFLLVCPCALGQEFPAPPTTIEEIQSKRDAAQAREDLAESLRTSISDAYQEAIQFLTSGQEWQGRAGELRRLREDAPARIAELETLLNEPVPPTAIEAEAASVAEWEILVRDAEARLEEIRRNRAELEREPARRAERRRAIPEQQEAIRLQLEEVRQELEALGSSTDAPELIEARRTRLEARQYALEMERLALDEELLSYDARTRTLGLRMQEEARNEQIQAQRVEQLRARLALQREADALEAAQRAREAILAASNAPEPIRELAGSLAQDAADIAQLQRGPDTVAQRARAAQERLDRVQQTLTDLHTRFETIQERVNTANRTSAMGILLRRERSALPSVWDYRREQRRRKDEIARIQIEQLQREDELSGLTRAQQSVRNAVAENAPSASEDEQTRMAELLRRLYETKRSALEGLLDRYDSYIDILHDLETAESELIRTTQEVRQLIDEHIHWIRSGPAVGPATVQSIVETRGDAAALVLGGSDPRDWLRDLMRTVPAYLGFLLALGLLLWPRRRYRDQLAVYAEQQADEKLAGTVPELKALAVTLYLALPIPLALWFIGWRLNVSLEIPAYTRPIGVALGIGGGFLYATELARHLLRRQGLACCHFGWPQEPCNAMRRDLAMLGAVSTPLIVMISAIEISNNDRLHEGWGRLLFTALMGVALVYGHRWMRPRNGKIHEIVDWYRGVAVLRGRRLGYALAVGVPLALIGVALWGYYYSALRVGVRIYGTGYFAFLVLVGMQLAQHSLHAARNRWVTTQRAKASEDSESSSDLDSDEGQAKDLIQDEADRMEQQSRRLVRALGGFAFLLATWLVWQSLFSAFEFLDQFEMWKLEYSATNEQGESVRQLQTITWRDGFAAAVIGIVAIMAVRNMPTILDVVLLRRSNIGAGERYAITTVFGYVLALVGILWAFQTIGLSWSKVQWLVAALGVGLGFGLQEIFANFISGLIILFERPIRVGDIVTIGDTSGTVSRIRIRATWITSFDRKELIVPNREFVTGRLTNWTLSDQILRIELPVGIAYGSDTGKAKRLLLQCARKNTHVLRDPRSEVYFMGFGDSTLNFELRVFCPGPSHILVARDQLNMAIDRAFRDAGIEIAFPQRDLHIRTIHQAFPKETPEEPKAE